MGLGVKVKIFHIGRRTSLGERVADALYKGKMEEVQQEMPVAVDATSWASGARVHAYICSHD